MIKNEISARDNNTNGLRNGIPAREFNAVKMRIIKRIQREKQPEAFWLTSVRHAALHQPNTLTCSEKERQTLGGGRWRGGG